ncbi:hypothetical protein M4V62_40045 [Streptomyces durmitorensis]|uniref:Uncharacterized protein n=1 Tax=Streptomyces durmitorensis TaxID=319947 RepID=A0ABY4Q3X4_9ACTN|nr:hypothetical protein [Streptomyces durmitorensis]UQT60767.1 hypothetical protein M4V62_40045 [Streptomyces durmitorensis]
MITIDRITMYRLLASFAVFTTLLVAAVPAVAAGPCDQFPQDSYAYAECEAQHQWSSAGA